MQIQISNTIHTVWNSPHQTSVKLSGVAWDEECHAWEWIAELKPYGWFVRVGKPSDLNLHNYESETPNLGLSIKQAIRKAISSRAAPIEEGAK